ncbi:uncharacterized protein [Haliotis cracherodii]|uniref:uncharacterized protein n=1 Tax=Haliotis cracherodii TaxID=6455 RepID=UPI0039E8D00A
MRSLSILSILALAAGVSAFSKRESCVAASDCHGITICATDGSLICSNDVCTCTHSCDKDQDLAICADRNECLSRFLSGSISCTCPLPWLSFHCIDQYCHCGYPTIST